MASDLYTIFPAVNSNYEFPPEVRAAIYGSADLQTLIDARADAKAQAAATDIASVRQYQNYRWTNAGARVNQTGMRVLDQGVQLDTGTEYVYTAAGWQVAGADANTVSAFMASRQYQSYRWTNDAAKNAQVGMRIYDRGIQLDTGVEWQYNGTAWLTYISPATPTNDASRLTSGTLPNARLDSGVVQAFRGDRNVDAPVSGENINGDWNTILQPGVFRIYAGAKNSNYPSGAYLYGTLVVFGAGSSLGSRTQMYFAHSGAAWYRTAWNGNDWGAWKYIASGDEVNNLQGQIDNRYTRQQIDGGFQERDNRLNNLEQGGTPGFTVAGGWTVNRANFWRAGRVLSMDLSLKRTGGAIASGNIANIKMGDVSGGFGSAGYMALSSGPGGNVSSFYLQGTSVFIAATSASIANNSEVTCGGTWIMS